MLSILKNRTYRHLFLAQIVALIGTGLATVALALLAYDLAGGAAGAVLGTALAIKMIANVGIAPVAAALADRLPRRVMLVGLDLARAGVALMLPFVSEVWQVYLLIFLLQSASAAFTPTYQATIPDIIEGEKEYTKALSLSRLAMDLETLISPMLAAALLAVLGYHTLFFGTAIGFAASAALVLSTTLTITLKAERGGFYDATFRGLRIYLATPRLRGLFAVNLAVAAAGALVLVNTVVFVQASFGLGPRETALALAAFGAGSMVAALIMPSLLDHVSDRMAVLAGATLLAAATLAASVVPGYEALLAIWVVAGVGFSLSHLPSGRLLRRSAHSGDRPAVYAAQFALSHACWLVTYPLAGWLGAHAGLGPTALVLCVIAVVAILITIRVWPAEDAEILAHDHADLPPDHPHLAVGETAAHGRHSHAYVIDSLHPRWPPAAKA